VPLYGGRACRLPIPWEINSQHMTSLPCARGGSMCPVFRHDKTAVVRRGLSFLLGLTRVTRFQESNLTRATRIYSSVTSNVSVLEAQVRWGRISDRFLEEANASEATGLAIGFLCESLRLKQLGQFLDATYGLSSGLCPATPRFEEVL